MKWAKLTISAGNLWRAGPLLSFLLLASGQQHLWITYFFVWFNRSTLHGEGTHGGVCTWNMCYIWEVTLPGCNLFMISIKPVFLVSFQKKFKNKHVHICIKPNPGTKHKDLFQMSLITSLAAFSDTILGLVSCDIIALWTLIYHCGRYSLSVLKWISLQACLRLFCFKLL